MGLPVLSQFNAAFDNNFEERSKEFSNMGTPYLDITYDVENAH